MPKKILRRYWMQLQQALVPIGAPILLRFLMQCAFYAGASTMFKEIREMGDKDEAQGKATLEWLRQECVEFDAQMTSTSGTSLEKVYVDADNPRLVRRRWLFDVQPILVPPKTPQRKRLYLRCAFFAGATVMFKTVRDTSKNGVTQAEAVERILAVERECNAFTEKIYNKGYSQASRKTKRKSDRT